MNLGFLSQQINFYNMLDYELQQTREYQIFAKKFQTLSSVSTLMAQQTMRDTAFSSAIMLNIGPYASLCNLRIEESSYQEDIGMISEYESYNTRYISRRTIFTVKGTCRLGI
jgi:hypothetical protein